MATPKESHSTKNKILDTAKKMALEEDFDCLTIRDICMEAQISVGAFYHHFSSKEEMINESFLLYDRDLEQRIDQYNESDPVGSLKKLLLDQTAYVSSFPYKLVIEYYRTLLSSSTKGALDHKRTYYKTVSHFVSLAIDRKDFSPNYTKEYLTNYFIKHIRGNLIHWCMHPNEMDVVSQTSYELEQLLDLFSNH